MLSASDSSNNDVTFWFNKGFSLYEKGNYLDSINCYTEALRLNPNYVDAWNNKGLGFFMLNRFEEAIECFNKAIAINPNSQNPHFNKAGSLRKLGRLEEAILCYNNAIQINPNVNAVWVYQGLAFIDLNRFEAAINSFDKALQIDPQDSVSWYNKGLCLERLYRFTEALACYQKSAELNSSNDWAIKKIAEISKLLTPPKTEGQKQVAPTKVIPERSELSGAKNVLKSEADSSWSNGDVNMLFFGSEQEIRDHIINVINANSPDRVLVAAGWERFASPFVEQASHLEESYVVRWNNNCSYSWLVNETTMWRNQQGSKVIIVSNYPREPRGDELMELCDKLDNGRRVAVFLVGAYTSSYINKVYNSQLCSKKENLHFQVLVSGGSDPSLLGSERKQLQACKNQQECHKLLTEISEKLEVDSNTPQVARYGAILMA